MKRPSTPDPFDWFKTAQDWFQRTERNSGFRSLLIFVVLHFGFVLTLIRFFPNSAADGISIASLPWVWGAFVVIFAYKAITDPDFCRTEKHIQSMKRIEYMAQKGDDAPKPINAETVQLIENPAQGNAERRDKGE